jgi:uncharacterized protein YbcV (DUF1398 family)
VILGVALLQCDLNAKTMKKAILELAIILAGSGVMVACSSTNCLKPKNQVEMFTIKQIKEELSAVRTGADFPVLAMNLKNRGVTYYETKMQDGSSIYHGKNGYELLIGPNYESIVVADRVNVEQLKIDIADHQQGKSDYFQISRQSAGNGIEKWAVCLITMTCTYLDKAGNKVWVEHIPDAADPKPSFTTEQIRMAHSKVKSGADFPAYIKEIKSLGVTHYEAYVTDGHIDYHGGENYTAKVPAKYDPIAIADTGNIDRFREELLAHQQGKTDFLTFIRTCAALGIEKWAISMNRMSCTYYDKAGNEVLVEVIPQ